MKAQKKPIIIDYYPIDNTDLIAVGTLASWVNSFGDEFTEHFEASIGELKVKTLEGSSYDVSNKDVIIRGIKGEYYPCKKDIFEQTYDKV